MLNFPGHPADVPVAIALVVFAIGGYLVHCQREHVRRKARRRQRATS